MLSWLKDRANVIGAVAGTIAAFVAVQQVFVVGPMNRRFDAMERNMDQRFDDQDKYINQRFDAMDQRFEAMDQRFDDQDKYINQRFDAVEQRLGRLEDDMAKLHALSDRVSRNEGEIDVIRQQLQTADAP